MQGFRFLVNLVSMTRYRNDTRSFPKRAVCGHVCQHSDLSLCWVDVERTDDLYRYHKQGADLVGYYMLLPEPHVAMWLIHCSMT